MYLFTRAGRFAPGRNREVTGFVGAMTDKVHQETGLEVHAWASQMSPDLGTVVWAAFVDDLARLEEAGDKLAVSDAIRDLFESGGHLLVGPLSDGLAQVVSGGPDPSDPLPGYVVTAAGAAANGHVAAAMAGGVEIAEAATRITGARTAFMSSVTGAYGGCMWSTGFPDIGALQRSEAALAADEGWPELIDRVGPAYAQGVRQGIYRRLT
jgi:hypothetical protein